MATRCTVKIAGFDTCKIYIHWDGYPEHKLAFLQAFNVDFWMNRGNDGSYKAAQLLRATALRQEEFGLDSSTHTGYGIVDYNSDCGEEYEYMLEVDGSVNYIQRSWKTS